MDLNVSPVDYGTTPIIPCWGNILRNCWDVIKGLKKELQTSFVISMWIRNWYRWIITGVKNICMIHLPRLAL